MQPDPATPTERPARWRGWLPRILAVAILVAAALTLVRLGVGGASEPTAEQRSATVKAELTRRMATILEQSPQAHQGHGAHGTATAKATTVCGARVYGFEPGTAASADAVVTVYGFHMCAVAEPRQDWQWATKFVAPLVMRFDTTPPTIQMAESTKEATYRERIDQLIPAQYRQLAVEGTLEPAEMDEFRRRYDDAAGV